MKKKIVVWVGVTLIVLIAITLAIYFYRQYQRTQNLLKNPTEAAKEEIRFLVNRVGKLIDLPKDEMPTVATVSDTKKLKDQPFFTKAQNGDKLLIFAKVKKAILYRPGDNKIIEVAPINLGESNVQSANVNATVSPTKVIKSTLVIYNGTKIVGYAATTERQIREKFPSVDVIAKSNTKNDYSKSLVVDLSGTKAVLIRDLAKLLSADVSSLPESEKKPDADILVILGK